MQGLGDLPDGVYESIAWAASGDGSVVVGYSRALAGARYGVLEIEKVSNDVVFVG